MEMDDAFGVGIWGSARCSLPLSSVGAPQRLQKEPSVGAAHLPQNILSVEGTSVEPGGVLQDMQGRGGKCQGTGGQSGAVRGIVGRSVGREMNDRAWIDIRAWVDDTALQDKMVSHLAKMIYCT